MQPCRRPREVEVVRDRDEVLELPQLHGPMIGALASRRPSSDGASAQPIDTSEAGIGPREARVVASTEPHRRGGTCDHHRAYDEAALDRGRPPCCGAGPPRRHEDPLLITRAKDVHVWDCEGREYLDCTSQAWTNNIGAGHPRVLAAAAAQAEQIGHARSNFDTIPLLLFSDRLVQRAPDGLTRVSYSLHGSTAVEMALKIAAKNRPGAGPPLVLVRRLPRPHAVLHGRQLAPHARPVPTG